MGYKNTKEFLEKVEGIIAIAKHDGITLGDLETAHVDHGGSEDGPRILGYLAPYMIWWAHTENRKDIVDRLIAESQPKQAFGFPLDTSNEPITVVVDYAKLPVLMPKRSVKVRPNGTIRGWNELLNTDLKGQTFQFESETYKYVGDNKRAKYSVIVQRVSDNTFFKTAAPVVARAFRTVAA